MDTGLEIPLIATIVIVVVANLIIVARRNAARARWAEQFWLSGSGKSSRPGF